MAVLVHKIIADFFYGQRKVPGTVADTCMDSDYMQFVAKYGNLRVDPTDFKGKCLPDRNKLICKMLVSTHLRKPYRRHHVIGSDLVQPTFRRV